MSFVNILTDEENNLPKNIITDLNFATDFVFNLTLKKLKSKFILDSKFNKYKLLNLNPCLRIIYITKLSFAIIKVLNPIKFVKVKYNRTYECEEVPEKIIDNIAKLLKYLVNYNGEIEFNPVICHGVELTDDDFDYEIIKSLAEKFQINTSKPLGLHMFDGNVFYDDFMNNIYLLHHNLKLYQLHISREEETKIKDLIRLKLINTVNSQSDIDFDKCEYLLPKELTKKFMSSKDEKQSKIFTFTDFTNTIKCKGFIRKMNDIEYLFEQIDEISQFNSLMQFIIDKYKYVLYINPDADYFKNDSSDYVQYFWFIDFNYSIYKKMINSMEFNKSNPSISFS